MNTTARLPVCCPRCLERYTMRSEVYGHRCPTRRVRLPFRLIFVAAFVGATGCTAHVPPVEVESVGALTASASSVRSAPVHATTDFGHAELVESAGDDAGDVVSTVTRTADAGGDALPEIAPKTDGVTTGTVR